MIEVLAILSPILLALLGAVGWLYRREYERRDEVEKQLSQKKYDTYVSIIEAFVGIMHSSADNKKFDERKLVSSLRDAQKKLLMYGSDDVLRSFIRLLQHAYKREDNLLEMMNRYSGLLISIRKDMAGKDTKIKPEDLLRMMITDYDETIQKLSKN